MMTVTANPVDEVLRGLFVIAENLAIERTPENLAALQQGLCAVFEGRYVEGAIKNEVTGLLEALMVALYTQTGGEIAFTKDQASSVQVATVNRALSKTFGSGKVDTSKFLASMQALFRTTAQKGDILAATAYLLPLAKQARAQVRSNPGIRNQMARMLNSGAFGVSGSRLVNFFGLKLRGGMDQQPSSLPAFVDNDYIAVNDDSPSPLQNEEESPFSYYPLPVVTEPRAQGDDGIYSELPSVPLQPRDGTHDDGVRDTAGSPELETGKCCAFIRSLRNRPPEGAPLLGAINSSSTPRQGLACPASCNSLRNVLAGAWNVLKGGKSAKGAFAWTAFYTIAAVASGGAIVRSNCDKVIDYQSRESMTGASTVSCSDLLSSEGLWSMVTRSASANAGLGDTAAGFVVLLVFLGFLALLYLFLGIYRASDVLCPNGCSGSCSCANCCGKGMGGYGRIGDSSRGTGNHSAD